MAGLRGHARGRWAGRVSGGVGHGARGRSDGRSASRRQRTKWRSHASSRHGLVTVGLNVHVARRAALSDRRRRAVTESAELVMTIVNLDSSGGVAGVVVDGVLHLSEKVVDLDKVLLCPGVGRHGEVVLLRKRVGTRTVTHGHRLRSVALSRRHGSLRNRHGAVQRKQGAANGIVRSRVDLLTLSTAEEVVDHVESALLVRGMGGVVAQVLGALVVQGRLVEVEAVVGGRLRRVVALVSRVARVLMLVLVVLGAHLAVVVVVRGS